jgi:hypothetical protein
VKEAPSCLPAECWPADFEIGLARVAAKQNINRVPLKTRRLRRHAQPTVVSPSMEPRAMIVQIFVMAVCLTLFMLPVLTKFWGQRPH